MTTGLGDLGEKQCWCCADVADWVEGDGPEGEGGADGGQRAVRGAEAGGCGEQACEGEDPHGLASAGVWYLMVGDMTLDALIEALPG